MHGNVIVTAAGDLRESAVRGCARAASIGSLMLTMAVALLSAPGAAGAPLAPSQQSQPQDTPAAPAPVQADTAPAPTEHASAHRHFGMVRYERPVYRHGVRVLWHGAWRDDAPSRAVAAEPPRPATSAVGHDILILADSADASATRMATEFAAAMQGVGIHVKPIAGKTSPAALDKAVSSDSVDLAVVPMDALNDSGKGVADYLGEWRARAPYIVRLANEPIALIAPRAITDIRQLTGRKVGVAAADGATAASAAIIFARLDIAPTTTNEPLPDALARLGRGEIDAVFVVGADDAKVLGDFGKDGRFHIVPIPYVAALQALYCPMRLTARDQANLIGPDERVDTIGAPMALLAIDAPPNSSRAERLAPLAERLFSQFDQRFGALPDSKWSEVNLAARITGWPRLAATQAWLDHSKRAPTAALDAFLGAAETAASASDVPLGADSDRLYDSLMKLSGAAQ